MGTKPCQSAARKNSHPASPPSLCGVAATAARVAGSAGLFSALVGVAMVGATPARADFQICNESEATRIVAIGYSENDQWVSEGWWHLDPGECATPITGDLTQRYIYYRADVEDTVQGVVFPGEGYMFCTSTDAFTIVGDQNCEARGYKTEDFREIDTGPTATTYSFSFTEEDVTEGF